MKCPMCGKVIAREGNPYRPFCSERCKLIDLGAWINEEYAVPSEERPPLPDDTTQSESTSDGGPPRDAH